MKMLLIPFLSLLVACSKQTIEPTRPSNCLIQLAIHYGGNFSYVVRVDTAWQEHGLSDERLKYWKDRPVIDTICMNLVTKNLFVTHKH